MGAVGENVSAIRPDGRWRGSRALLRAVVVVAAALSSAVVAVPAVAGAAPLSGSLTPLISGAPVVLSLKPAEGGEAGGTKVKITGEHLAGVTTVHFGETAVTLSKANKSETKLTVTSPAGRGTVDVTLSTAEATSEAVPADRFSYRSALPVVTGLNPNAGPASSKRKITISGSNFTGVTKVSFGSLSVPFTIVKSTRLQAVAPVAVVDGPVDITITTGAGTSEPVPADVYEFQAEFPSVEAVTPEIGPSGETVMLEGEGFIGTSKVSFEGVPAASFEVINDGLIRAVTPEHATERVAIVITTPLGTSRSACGSGKCPPIAHYKFRPQITSVSPASGPLAGGTPITLTGTGFNPGYSRIDIGTLEVISVNCSSETSCTALTPAQKTAGKLPVQMHVPSNYNTKESVSPITEATEFTYE